MVNNRKPVKNSTNLKQRSDFNKQHNNKSKMLNRIPWILVIIALITIISFGVVNLINDPKNLSIEFQFPTQDQTESHDRERNWLIDNHKIAGNIAADAEPTLSSKKFICRKIKVLNGLLEKPSYMRQCYVRYLDVVPATKSFNEISGKRSIEEGGNVCGSFVLKVDGTEIGIVGNASVETSYVSFFRKGDILPTEPIIAGIYAMEEDGKYLPRFGDYKLEKLGGGNYGLCGIPSTTTAVGLSDSLSEKRTVSGFSDTIVEVVRDFPHEEGRVVGGFLGEFVLAPSLDIDKNQDYVVNAFERTYIYDEL